MANASTLAIRSDTLPRLHSVPASTERLIPQSLEAERSVLGAMLIDDEAVADVLGCIDGADFFRNEHRLIFSAMLSALEQHHTLDLVLLITELRKQNRLEEVGGDAYLAELIEYVPTAALVKDYCRVVLEKATLRRMLLAADRIIGAVYSDDGSSFDAIARAQSDLYEARQRLEAMDGPQVTGIQRIDDIVPMLVAEMAEFQAPEFNWRTYYTMSGIGALDERMLGFKPGELVLVKALPSHGKSAFGVQVADSVLRSNEHRNERRSVLFVTAEMTKTAITWRLVQHRTGVGKLDFVRTKLPPSVYDSVQNALIALEQEPLYVQYEARAEISILVPSLEALMPKIDRPGVVVFDHLQDLRDSTVKDQRNHEREVANIVQAVSGFAKRNNIPVVLLSQINAQGEAKWSRKSEETADVVLRIHKQKASDLEGDIWIEKNRDFGSTGQIGFQWSGRQQRFSDVTEVSS